VIDESKVKDPLERERLARIFEKGLESDGGLCAAGRARARP
jgi:phosphopantothenate synthetase